MCGIAGIVTPSAHQARTAVRTMNRAQRHRGPDDEGEQLVSLAHGHLALGHRRLSIIDLSAAGHQPMTNPATGDWLVYNGELYNFQELRLELESHGIVFRTKTDTEVVLEAYAMWAERCVTRFCGMFALAIYDAAKRRLVLARDHLGIKPLYIARSEEALAFASEVQALLATGLFGRGIDRRALGALLAYGTVPEPLTIVKDAQTVEAGTYAVLDLAGPRPWKAVLRSVRYWDFPLPQADLAQQDATRQLAARLSQAVESHLISDVPVGIFLSSGIDSNAIAALASEHRGGDLDAFTVTWDGHPEGHEGHVAATTASRLAIRFHAIGVTQRHAQLQAPAFLECLDQPTVDGLNTYLISQAVRERGIVVALSGLGGDEVFGGYNSFHEAPRLARWHRASSWIPPRWRKKIAAWLYRHQPMARRYKAMELASRPCGLRSFCLRRRRLFSDTELTALGFDAHRLQLDQDFLPFESAPDRRLAAADATTAVSIIESRFYMGNMLLRDADAFGMRHGLEIRVPLLDRRVVELGYAIPGHLRLKRSRINKPLLVQAVGGRLRPDLLRLTKRGFHVPIATWLRGPLRELAEDTLVAAQRSGMFDPHAVRSVWQDFRRTPDDAGWSRVWMLCVMGAYAARSSCPCNSNRAA